MRKIRETLRLHFYHRLSQRKIARSVGIGQPTVHDYLCRFTSSGLVWPLPPELTDEALEAQFYPEPVTPAAADRPMPDFAPLQEELRRHKHTTLHLLWSEYRVWPEYSIGLIPMARRALHLFTGPAEFELGAGNGPIECPGSSADHVADTAIPDTKHTSGARIPMRDAMPGYDRQSAGSGGIAVVVVQHAAQALTSLDGA